MIRRRIRCPRARGGKHSGLMAELVGIAEAEAGEGVASKWTATGVAIGRLAMACLAARGVPDPGGGTVGRRRVAISALREEDAIGDT